MMKIYEPRLAVVLTKYLLTTTFLISCSDSLPITTLCEAPMMLSENTPPTEPTISDSVLQLPTHDGRAREVHAAKSMIKSVYLGPA